MWLEADLAWFREPVFAAAPPLPFPVPPGLAASRRRREAWRQKRTSRRARATAIAMSPAVILPFALRNGGQGSKLVLDDPPSLTFRLGPGSITTTDAHLRPVDVLELALGERVREQSVFPRVVWHHAVSLGLPYDGRLVDGTQLPIDGPAWVTWDPVTNSVPNQRDRLYGNQHTIRTIIAVTEAYHAAHPWAPRVVIGDISWRNGGPLDEHVSHQNGLDVDVYYPRVDGELRAPTQSDQIDTALAQDLLNRFVAAGAQMIFVGFHARLHGPAGVVIPYPNHEYHMHVRFPHPA
jgi:hypothetical protein